MDEDNLKDWFERRVWPDSSSTSDEFLDYIIQFMSEMHGIHLLKKHEDGRSYFTSNDDDFKIYMKDVLENEPKELGRNSWTLVLEEAKPFMVYDIVSYNFYPFDVKQYNIGDKYCFEWKSANIFDENIWDFHNVGSPQRFIFERKEYSKFRNYKKKGNA